ncbi:MAG: autotransporter domain-containing protein [Rhodospirillales bacterium]|nr:autotransporter domain-containing protein [Rhodospirillales bacterium]
MTRPSSPSLRSLLLASAAGIASLGAAGSAHAGVLLIPPTVTVSTQQSSLTTLLNLYQGQTLVVTSTGGLTIEALAVGTQPAVATAANAVAAILNSGTITSNQTAYHQGVGIEIAKGTTLGLLTNNAGGTIQATGSAATAIDVRGTLTALTNAGLILATARSAYAITNNYGYIGSLTNAASGIIETTGDYGSALVNYGTLSSLANAGLIQANGLRTTGIYNNYGYIGSVTNAAGGTVETTGDNSNAILNYGTIQTLANAGRIQASGTSANAIQDNYGYIGSITNAAGATITATGTNADAIYGNYGYIGSITNAAGAAIIASGSGSTAIYNYGTLDTLANAGLIQANGTNANAIDNNYTYLGSITNAATGVIQATGSGGIAITNSQTIGSIVNAGTIQSLLGPAIVNSGSINNGITNTASGLIQGGPANGSGIAIDNSGGSTALSILNAGTIIGAVLQSGNGDTLTVTGGAIVGDVVGVPGSAGAANFDLGANSFTLGGNINTVDTVSVLSGRLIMPAGGGTIFGAQAFNIASGATATVGGAVNAALTTNDGVLEASTGAATLQGNYVQDASGSLQIDLGASGASQLTVTGSAAITPGSRSILVHVAGAANVPASSTILVAQGGLNIVGGGTTLTAVSDTANPYFSTPIVTDPVGTLTLTFVAPTQQGLLNYAAGLFPVGSTYLNGAAAAYAARIGTLNASTYTTITDAIAALPPSDRIAFAQQAAPRSVASAAAELANGLGANTALSRAIADRQMAARAATSVPTGHDTVLWSIPFASTAYQSSVQDFGGFGANTYGAAIGADTRVSPNLRIGVAFAAANSNIDYTGGASANMDTITSVEAGVYASYLRHGFFVDGALGGGLDRYTSKQEMAFLGRQSSSYDGSQLEAQARTGYELPLGDGATLTPNSSLREIHLNVDGYTMTGGTGPSAHVNSVSLDLVQSRIGARLDYKSGSVGGWLLQPYVHAYYLHNFNTSGVTTSGSFSNGLDFAVAAPSRDANLADIGFGLTADVPGGMKLGATASYTAGRSTNIGTLMVRLATRF